MTYVMTSIALAAITRNAINTKKRRSNIITLSFFAHQPRMCGYYKKESVRLILIYLVRGSGIPIPQINNTPHSYLSTRMGQNTPIEESIQSDECVAFLVVLKFSRFRTKDKS